MVLAFGAPAVFMVLVVWLASYRFTRDRTIALGERGFRIGGGNEYLFGEVRRIAAKWDTPESAFISFSRKERLSIELLMRDGNLLTVHDGMPGYAKFLTALIGSGEIPSSVMQRLALHELRADWTVLFDRADFNPA
jgi:hypothetical protein